VLKERRIETLSIPHKPDNPVKIFIFDIQFILFCRKSGIE